MQQPTRKNLTLISAALLLGMLLHGAHAVSGQQPANTTAPATAHASHTQDPPLTSTEKAFYEAIRHNDIAKIKTLIEQGQNPNMAGGIKGSDGKRRPAPLEWAIFGSLVDVIDVLLKHGANPNFKDPAGTPLLALSLSEAASSRRFLKRADSLQPEQQERLLRDLNNQRSISHLLLDHGADPNSRYELGNDRYTTALALATEMDDLDLVKRLIELGARVNEPKNSPSAPLFKAAANINVEIARLLLEAGGDVFARAGKESYSRTFLSHAISTGNLEFSLLPLQYGATLDDYAARMFDGDERTPYDHRLLAVLLKKGMDVRNSRPYPPVKGKNLASLKLMLEAGAPICKRSRDGKTTYEDAQTYGTSPEILDYLKTQGGDRCPPSALTPSSPE